MPDGRGVRFALEMGFLLGLAVALAFASVRPAWIAGVMLVGWLIVAALEWTAWHEEPHWASGSPPRYYVPRQPLPPGPPGHELPVFSSYPRSARRETEAPTWIATPELREEMLGWPAAPADPDETDGEAPADAAAEPDPQTTVEELPEELLQGAANAALEKVGWPVAEEESRAATPVEALAPVRLARHRIDPFEDPAAGRRLWPLRGGAEAPAGTVAAMPALPRHERVPGGRPDGDGG